MEAALFWTLTIKILSAFENLFTEIFKKRFYCGSYHTQPRHPRGVEKAGIFHYILSYGVITCCFFPIQPPEAVEVKHADPVSEVHAACEEDHAEYKQDDHSFAFFLSCRFLFGIGFGKFPFIIVHLKYSRAGQFAFLHSACHKCRQRNSGKYQQNCCNENLHDASRIM